MIKKVFAVILAITMITSFMPIIGVEAANKTVQAAYGTPIVDGTIDEIWNITNYTTIDTITSNRVTILVPILLLSSIVLISFFV